MTQKAKIPRWIPSVHILLAFDKGHTRIKTWGIFQLGHISQATLDDVKFALLSISHNYELAVSVCETYDPIQVMVYCKVHMYEAALSWAYTRTNVNMMKIGHYTSYHRPNHQWIIEQPGPITQPILPQSWQAPTQGRHISSTRPYQGGKRQYPL